MSIIFGVMEKDVKEKIIGEIVEEMGGEVSREFVEGVINYGLKNIVVMMGKWRKYEGRGLMIGPNLSQYANMLAKRERGVEREMMGDGTRVTRFKGRWYKKKKQQQ